MKTLFDTGTFITQQGIDTVFRNSLFALKFSLATNDKETYENVRNTIVNGCYREAKGKGLRIVEIASWEEAQLAWVARAESCISKIYRIMSKIDVNALGLEEADRKRQVLQRRLNLIGRLAANRGRLREDDGYTWIDTGDGRYMPRRPL